MIYEAGYPAETHTVVTEDGYILRMHRIPHGKHATNRYTVPIECLWCLSLEITGHETEKLNEN